MINLIPIVGWAFSVLLAASVAVPFWFLWTHCGLGAEYFYFIPKQFQSIPFMDCVGLFIIVSILKPTLTPTFSSVSNTSESKGK